MRPFDADSSPRPADVWQAMLDPMYFTFSSRMQEVILRFSLAAPDVRYQRRVISTSATTGLMEASIRNGVRETLLVVVGGYFGEMYARVAGCGKEVIRINVPPGETLNPGSSPSFSMAPKSMPSRWSLGIVWSPGPSPDLVRVIRNALVLVDG